jgi:hypothetical protein
VHTFDCSPGWSEVNRSGEDFPLILQQDCCCTLSPGRAGTKPGHHTQPKPERPVVAATKRRPSRNESRQQEAEQNDKPRRRRQKEATSVGTETRQQEAEQNDKPAVAATKRRPSRKVSRQQEAEQNDKPRRRCHEEATEPERKPGSKKPSRTTSPAVAARKK